METANDALRGGDVPDPAYREVYPWHAENWARLTRALERLPHALLLHGQEGLGKFAFALRLANTLVCAAPGADAAACGQCNGCQLFAAGTHPDLVVIRPLEDTVVISVDQVRALGGFLGLRPHTAAHKVVILSPAQAMNQNAANALLKLLEEPPDGSVFLLVTPHRMHLPPTVRSRCVPVVFLPPDDARARAWLAERVPDIDRRLLKLAGGAPLAALTLAKTDALSVREDVARDLDALLAGRAEPLRCAARWKALGTERSLCRAQEYLAEILRNKMTAGTNIYSCETSDLIYIFDVVSEAKRLAATPVDEMLLLEDTLIRAGRFTENDRLN